jgi:release factor glutamine methyltransferase
LRLPRGATVIDVGTGSGAIALALADERPDLDITATDIDRDALAVAAINADRLGLDVSFLHGDLLEQAGGRIDAVISNPPYLADDEMAGLEPEVVDHEPRIALCAGADGLGAVRRLVAEAAARNVPAIALEIGIGQADEALALIAAAGWTQTEVIDDLAGIARVVAGTRAQR